MSYEKYEQSYVDVQKSGGLLLIFGVRECIPVEMRVEPSSRNKTVRVDGEGRTHKTKRAAGTKTGEVTKDGTCMKDSQ